MGEETLRGFTESDLDRLHAAYLRDDFGDLKTTVDQVLTASIQSAVAGAVRSCSQKFQEMVCNLHGKPLDYANCDLAIRSVTPVLAQKAFADAVENRYLTDMRQQLTRLTEEKERLAKALRALIDRLNFVHEAPEFKSVWQLSYLHGMPYEGPTYEKELADAQAALTPAAGGETRKSSS